MWLLRFSPCQRPIREAMAITSSSLGPILVPYSCTMPVSIEFVCLSVGGFTRTSAFPGPFLFLHIVVLWYVSHLPIQWTQVETRVHIIFLLGTETLVRLTRMLLSALPNKNNWHFTNFSYAITCYIVRSFANISFNFQFFLNVFALTCRGN